MFARSICVVIGTRPEAIKLAPLIQRLKQEGKHQIIIYLTGQHREMVDQIMQQFALEADRDLAIMEPGQSLSGIAVRSLQGLADAFQETRPDLVIVQGDTTTAFAATLAAFYQGIDVAHVEAGLRTDNLREPFPEEANRRLISQLASLHFAPTRRAVENIEACGAIGAVYETGNTVIDALLEMASRFPECPIPGLEWNKYRTVLVTIHRRENWGRRIDAIAQALVTLLDSYEDLAIVLPLHRNPTVRNPLQAKLGGHPRAYLTEPLDYPELVGAMQRCHFLLTDSGGLQEEAPSLGKPVLVLRDTTERPEAIETGTARLVGTETAVIIAAAAELLDNQAVYSRMANRSNPFGDGHAAERIVVAIDEFFSGTESTQPGDDNHSTGAIRTNR